MPSSIPGYEYDIFISYRQKDNLYDSWVTEFIANLRKELEATFKEDIFIYTDENKYDGIREMHLVDDSISSKLKCLIFIPIISQTYCDPKSYAWKNEFLVFRELAAQDPFGLKIKLQNGNVTSRIVPVRIHDLDPQDKSLFENETGGPLRSVDFIFKAPGVNRPLSAHEDHPQENLDKTYYRDQINKVANLIKEIILSLKSPELQENLVRGAKQATNKSKKFNGLSGRFIAAAVLITLFLMVYFYTRSNLELNLKSGDGRVAIAVLPFKVIGIEEESRYFADGVMEQILTNLTIFPELKVKPETSVEKYRNTHASIPEIADELNVRYILRGSAQKIGTDIRITVQLIDARTDINVWSQSFVKNYNMLFEIQDQISEAVAGALKARLTPDIAQHIRRRATSSFEGYDLFLRGRQLGKKYANTKNVNDLESAIGLIEQSLKKDDNFALGYSWLAGLKALRALDHINDQQVKDSILLLANKAVAIDSTVVEAYLVLSLVYNYLLDDVNALRFTYKAIGVNEGDSTTSVELIKRLASIYSRVGEEDKAIFLCDELLKLNSSGTEILRLKFYPLASSRRIDQLVELSNQIKLLHTDDVFADLIMTHVWTERKDYQQIEQAYHQRKNLTSEEMNLLDQYILIYATALRKNGKEAEAMQLAIKFGNTISKEDAYLQAQHLLFMGKNDEGLRRLESVEIGWYNLNLCYINPVFEKVGENGRFKDFLRINSDRIMNQRDRIRQLETRGYLPRPEDLFQSRPSRDKS